MSADRSLASDKLMEMFAAGASSFPTFTVARETYAEHVMSHVPADVDVIAHLAQLHAVDLYLAAACATGDGAAVAAFEARCFVEIPFAHARIRPRMTIDEVEQHMRVHLFVRSSDEQRPKILQYAGVGDIRGWFRMVLVRQLLNMVRVRQRERDLDEALIESLPAAATGHPEIERACQQYAPLLRGALVTAIASLEPRERTVLRLAVCDGLTVDALADLYEVHRATAARWVVRARAKLEAAVRATLAAALGTQGDSLDSLLQLVVINVDLSLRRHLGAGAPEPPVRPGPGS
jgi:RNA polymerase sigma-70 factor (ECF subfamily)